MKYINLVLATFYMMVLSVSSIAQPRTNAARRSLDSLAMTRHHLNDLTDISVTKFSVYELLKALAVSNDLNMEVNFSPSKTITCNLKQVPVKDVISYCCSQKELTLKVVDGIISVTDWYMTRMTTMEKSLMVKAIFRMVLQP